MARTNVGFGKAKSAKNDEFYTQLNDISKELKFYKNHFKNKIVFCNCDDPFESNFFKYFAMNFNYLGLKKLICTCYVSSPIMYTQLSLFGKEISAEAPENKKPYKIEITEVPDSNGDGAIDITDVEYLVRNDKNVLTILEGDGDFRSEECIELLKEADIIVTNPPFSLFRDYVSTLMRYEKQFLIIGNINCITYKEIFPLIKENKVWLGTGMGRWISGFIVPDNYELYGTEAKIDETKGSNTMKTKIRKIMAIIMALTFVLSLAGCNGVTEENDQKPNELKVAVDNTVINVDDAFEHFTEIQVDGKTVFTKEDLVKHYEAVKNGEDVKTQDFKVMQSEDGNLKIIISDEYLKNLKDGDHTLKVLTKTGETDEIKITKDKDKIKINDTVLDLAEEETKEETENTEDKNAESENTDAQSNNGQATDNNGAQSNGNTNNGNNTDSSSDTNKSSDTKKFSDNSGSNKTDNTSNNNPKKDSNSPTTTKPATTTTTAAPTPERNYAYASQFLSLLNSYRASLGLSQLGMESFMQEHCMQRANDLINDYSHNHHGHDALAGCPIITKTEELPEYDEYGCPTGKTVTNKYTTLKYSANGECIYRNTGMTPAEALAGFKASAGHNAILTTAYCTHVGVGVVSYNGWNYYCVTTYTDMTNY